MSGAGVGEAIRSINACVQKLPLCIDDILYGVECVLVCFLGSPSPLDSHLCTFFKRCRPPARHRHGRDGL
jgi:hypothetical protein